MRTRRTTSSSDPVSPQGHRSVLLHEAIEQLELAPDDIVVDATLGGAGHARAIAQQLGSEGILIGFDLDADAIARAQDALRHAACRTHLVEANFRDVASATEKLGIAHITKALFDLGWSSYQLDAGRGFSFLADEPLLMTYSKDSGALTARTAVNEWSEESLADVIWGFGGEHFARRIARAIVERRAQKPIETSRELAELIKTSVPAAYRTGRLHPATRTFQALRIAVNDELGALEKGLDGAWSLLQSGGRIAVITFHSIEDRFVKQRFAAWEKAGVGRRVTKKPIVPTSEELRENPRARSAKLRIIEKINL
jgi:16S rRNA (cytosine1402-N4)-methyltransferase